MNYALAYAPKAASYWASWPEAEESHGSFKGSEKKFGFLDQLSSGDNLFTEMGSGNYKFCLAASLKGVEVWRLPIQAFEESFGKIKVERGNRAECLAQIAREKPEKFYIMRSCDENLARLGILIDAYEAIQRTVRIPVQLRLQSIYSDMNLIDAEQFQKKVREQFAPEQIFAEAHSFEATIKKEIVNLLKTIPVAQIFEDILGFGPLITARIIARTGDIRRFRSVSAYKAYAGWHCDEDGQCPKRKKGERANWNSALKMAFYLWIDQVNRHDPEKDPWKALLLRRKVYERTKFPAPIKVTGNNGEKILFSDAHIAAKAARHVIQKFIEQVLWPKWRELEGIN